MTDALDPIVISLGVSDSPSRRGRDLARRDRGKPDGTSPTEIAERPSPRPEARAEPVVPPAPGPAEFIAAVTISSLPGPTTSAADALRAQTDRWSPPQSPLSLTDRRA